VRGAEIKLLGRRNSRVKLGLLIVMGAALMAQTTQNETGSSQRAVAAGGTEIFHVAIFRFTREHLTDAMTAFRAPTSASRRDPGNLRYDIYPR
jgi:hypothetical protein